MATERRKREKLGRDCAFRWSLSQCQKPASGFFPKYGQLLGRGLSRRVGDVTQLSNRAHLHTEQITIDQLRQMEVGVISHQAFDLVERFPLASLADEPVD